MDLYQCMYIRVHKLHAVKKLLLIVKAMYFSNPFGRTCTFTSNVPISLIVT